jgi:hypothetical protein
MAAERHARAVREFPDYELLAVKQKMGKLAFQGVPSTKGAGASDVDQNEAIASDSLIEPVAATPGRCQDPPPL